MKCLLIHRYQHNTEYYSIIDEVSLLNDIRINKLPMKLPLKKYLRKLKLKQIL